MVVSASATFHIAGFAAAGEGAIWLAQAASGSIHSRIGKVSLLKPISSPPGKLSLCRACAAFAPAGQSRAAPLDPRPAPAPERRHPLLQVRSPSGPAPQLPVADPHPPRLLERPGLPHPPALRRRDGGGHLPPRHRASKPRPRPVESRLRPALPPPHRRPLRRESEPAPALLPV